MEQAASSVGTKRLAVGLTIMTSTYVYRAIQKNEIRLLNLLPGQLADDLRFTIFHTPLIKPKTVIQPKRLFVEALRSTVPEGWFMTENYEGRYLFEDEVNLPNVAQFEHPNPNVPRELWEPALDHIDVGFEPLYDALSYEWGSMSTQELAFVSNSVERGEASTVTNQGLYIGSNLALALRYVRSKTEARTLWADAICINQKDVVERNKQVPRMREIFGLSRRVILWVGPEEADSPLAVRTLNHLAKQFEICKQMWHLSPTGASEPLWWTSRTVLPWTEEQRNAVEAFYSRSYFTRVWVIQEMCLGNRRAVVACGHDTIPFPDFRRATLALSHREGVPQRIFHLISALGQFALVVGVAPILFLLKSAKYRICLDPRDKVYGILSLAPPRIAAKVVPNYSLSVREIYKHLALSYINVTDRLDLMLLCGASQEPFALPTWVPNWAGKLSTFGTSEDAWQAAGISRSHVEVILDGEILEVIGKKVATLSRVEAIVSGRREDIEITIGEVFDDLDSQTYPTGESSADALL